MPGDEYSSATGGALKLKGAKVGKKKKKSKKDKGDLERALSKGKDKEADEDVRADDDEDDERVSHKTEAERRHEETKRKRLLEQSEKMTKPELLKTHKERVEELNTYLSKLSEHHDMPKIGPG